MAEKGRISQFTTNVIEYLINNSFSEFKFREFYCNFWLRNQKRNEKQRLISRFLFWLTVLISISSLRHGREGSTWWNTRALIGNNKLGNRMKYLLMPNGRAPLARERFNWSHFRLRIPVSFLATLRCCTKRARQTKTHQLYVTRI